MSGPLAPSGTRSEDPCCRRQMGPGSCWASFVWACDIHLPAITTVLSCTLPVKQFVFPFSSITGLPGFFQDRLFEEELGRKRWLCNGFITRYYLLERHCMCLLWLHPLDKPLPDTYLSMVPTAQSHVSTQSSYICFNYLNNSPLEVPGWTVWLLMRRMLSIHEGHTLYTDRNTAESHFTTHMPRWCPVKFQD